MGILMEATEGNLRTASYGSGKQLFGAMGTPDDAFYSDTVHAITINTRETEFGKIVEPIPITLKAYQQFQGHGHALHGYGFPTQMLNSFAPTPRITEDNRPTTSTLVDVSPVKEEARNSHTVHPPPKKKWIKEYLEEEPKSPVSVRVVTGLSVARSSGAVRPLSPPAPAPPAPPTPPAPAPALAPTLVFEPAPAPVPAPVAPPPVPLLDFVQEHSRPRTTSISHGTPQIPSPPSVGSNGSNGSSSGSGSGSAPRAGTREVHNKLEKNRRAHLKECFELLKRQLPATPDDKKTSNLSILASAIRYIQVLRRKERECEHEMERLAREKIAAQQRLAALKREVSVRGTSRPRSIEAEEMDSNERVNGHVLGIPISITSSPPRVARLKSSPPRSLNLSTKLRTLPIQITPTTSQVVRTSYGSRHNTLTLTTLAPADTSVQNGQLENGVTGALSTLVHPAQIHLPISQVVGGGGLVVGPAALQLLAAGGGLRVLQPAVHTNGVSNGESNHRMSRENGIGSSSPPTSTEGVVVSGLAPLVVSQPAHLLQTHTLTHKMVETHVVKGPLTVSAQYLSAAALVKPLVVLPPAPLPPAEPQPPA